MAGQKTPAKGARSGRKLPRTPDEYAELNMKTCAAASSQSANNNTASGVMNQLELSLTHPKVGPLALDKISESSSTLSEASQHGEGTSGCHSYITVLHVGTVDDVKQQNVLISTQSGPPVTRSDEKIDNNEKLNPETMGIYQGSATTFYEKLNKATMEPQTCSTDFDDTSMTMHLDKGFTQSACPAIRSGHKTCGYEKMNPETMDSYQGSVTTCYEKLNKATMDPQTCSGDFVGASMTMHLDEQTSQSACLKTISDDKKGHHERLDPDTMDKGSSATGYEKLNKATMEPQTCSTAFHDTGITMHLNERSVCSTPRSDDKINDYEKLNPETMDSYHKSDTTDYEELNRTMMEPQDFPDDPDDKGIWINLGIWMEWCLLDKVVLCFILISNSP